MKGNKKWELMQENQLNRYLHNPVGVFSTKETKSAIIVGEKIRDKLHGRCLDIGSGILGKPYYMKIANNIEWTGVDPYKGKPKYYSFIQGYAEKLPFRNNWFDGVLFATSLDHIAHPAMAITEARRVLKKNGLVFLWQTILDGSKPLMEEEYKKMHMNYFTRKDINILFDNYTLIEVNIIKNLQNLFIYKK